MPTFKKNRYEKKEKMLAYVVYGNYYINVRIEKSRKKMLTA
jgi:hypothetical protein